MNKKLKVAWICYFTNNEVQTRLKPIKKVGEIAPWISNLIPLFENREDIELHIISQHKWIPFNKSFTIRGVHYHFLHYGLPLAGRHWPGFFRFDLLTGYCFLYKKIRKVIDSIKPDIIHLQGAENEFSASSLQFQHKYPVFTTIQGFVSKSTAKSKVATRRKEKEIEILKTFRHFGVRTETMANDVKAINPDAKLHWHTYRIVPAIPDSNIEKKYDLVFFARISKDKGIGDLLQAVANIKKDKPSISLCVVGGGNADEFKQMASDLGIAENITWAGFMPTQEAAHRIVATAKISVLPTYHDIIPGTIVESMFLGLPVIAYNVGSIHEVNRDDDIIYLIAKWDINGLTHAISELLNDPEQQKQRAEKGYKKAFEMFVTPDDEIRSNLIRIYNEVIADFKAS